MSGSGKPRTVRCCVSSEGTVAQRTQAHPRQGESLTRSGSRERIRAGRRIQSPCGRVRSRWPDASCRTAGPARSGRVRSGPGSRRPMRPPGQRWHGKPRKRDTIDPKTHGHETDKPAKFCQDVGTRPASARVQARPEPDVVEMMVTPDWVQRLVAHGRRRAEFGAARTGAADSGGSRQ